VEPLVYAHPKDPWTLWYLSYRSDIFYNDLANLNNDVYFVLNNEENFTYEDERIDEFKEGFLN
jgi:hypothetical protein